MKRRCMMIVALLATGMLFRTAGMESVAEGSVSNGNAGGDAEAEGTVSSGDAVPLADPEIVSIQIPERLNVVLNPWEMDGREQIYSEQYAVQNTGTTAGILTLSFRCRVQEGSRIIVRPDGDGLHEGEEKSIYIEMRFGDDRVLLSEEDSEYRAELAPGEALPVSFTGGMNENAAEPWRDGEIEIEGRYSWEPADSAGESGQEE